MFSSPHGDFSFSIDAKRYERDFKKWFSSPHGDFSFSMELDMNRSYVSSSFRPLTGISLFLWKLKM